MLPDAAQSETTSSERVGLNVVRDLLRALFAADSACAVQCCVSSGCFAVLMSGNWTFQARNLNVVFVYSRCAYAKQLTC